ncbi:MAG: hypothetical protein NZL92_00200 [Gloeomargarita sp. SKYG116]|nr:hypothetical protein [Gloeomargarita sp. SKYG116]MCS7225926.1 hypothetical protein [Gloeomargarita sp. SKYB31]MDW8400098.1 hypothetical protein [Gloeomargarita sp. SKYGB_i_bin116]
MSPLTPVSGLFLAGACVSAIAAVGCVFELGYGQPQLGVPLTWTILLLSTPATVACFWAAVRSARQE